MHCTFGEVNSINSGLVCSRCICNVVILQVAVAWEDPPGPERSDNCPTPDTPYPPPFPINDITIRSPDTDPITETDGRGDVTVTVRLVLI